MFLEKMKVLIAQQITRKIDNNEKVDTIELLSIVERQKKFYEELDNQLENDIWVKNHEDGLTVGITVERETNTDFSYMNGRQEIEVQTEFVRVRCDEEVQDKSSQYDILDIFEKQEQEESTNDQDIQSKIKSILDEKEEVELEKNDNLHKITQQITDIKGQMVNNLKQLSYRKFRDNAILRAVTMAK